MTTEPTASVTPRTVLVVEDDRKTSELISVYLNLHGFAPLQAFSGRDAIGLAARHHATLAILDVMLPDLDGWEVCRMLRKNSAVPILMLSSLGQAEDRIKGLELGADDYVAKPFSPKELMARVNAIVRRTCRSSAASEPLSREGIVVDIQRKRVSVNGREIALTPSEFRLLHALIAAPGRVYDREELLTYLYPHGGVVIDRVVDVHIGKLRQKLEEDPGNPRFILTSRGHGYCFADGSTDRGDAAYEPSRVQ